MKSNLIHVMLFCFAIGFVAKSSAATCNEQIGYEFKKPKMFASLWTNLSEVSKHAEVIKPTDSDIQQAGLCLLNVTGEATPNEAVTAPAPAMLIKSGSKLFVLLQKNYSFNLAPWAYGESACLNQIESLKKSAQIYLNASTSQVQFDFKNDIYTLKLSSSLTANTFSAKKAGSNYIVQKDGNQYCIFNNESAAN